MNNRSLCRKYSDADQYDQLLASCKSQHDVTVALDSDRRRSLSFRKSKIMNNNLSMINNYSYNK